VLTAKTIFHQRHQFGQGAACPCERRQMIDEISLIFHPLNTIVAGTFFTTFGAWKPAVRGD